MGASGRKKTNRRKKSVQKNNVVYGKEKGRWICLNLSERYKKNNESSKAISSIKTILGKDLIHILIVGHKLDDGHYSNEMDGYVFLKCTNIEKHIDSFKQSKYIASVLNSFDSLVFIDDMEIRDMVRDYNIKSREKRKKTDIRYGDRVEVKSGKYSNLVGVVVDKLCSDKYIVNFKFNFGIVKDKIFYSNIVIKNNIFESVKCPVT